jgi:hypothetical protein
MFIKWSMENVAGRRHVQRVQRLERGDHVQRLKFCVWLNTERQLHQFISKHPVAVLNECIHLFRLHATNIGHHISTTLHVSAEISQYQVFLNRVFYPHMYQIKYNVCMRQN